MGMGIDYSIDQMFGHASDIAEAIVFYSIELRTAGPDDTVLVHNLPLILVWLAVAAVFFTIYLGFINIRYFKHAVAVTLGKHNEPGADGQINNWQALAASLSGTVGLGNIAGVAVAVSVGGPGAVLWMMLMGFFGMTSKFAESTLAVKYRHHPDPNHPEKIAGGPMYYLRDIFANRNIPYVGTILAAIFAVCCIGGALGGGNMFQANQTFTQLVNVTGGTDNSWLLGFGWAFGLFLAFLVGLVIIGGIKSIGRVAGRLVPFMAGLYLIAGLIVILMHFSSIPAGLATIFTMAFSLEAGFGGFLGGLLVGIQRAAFSNEAGIGASSIVHAAAKTDKPVSQGFVGMLGPFIDTIVICMVTALVIVFTGVYEAGQDMEGVTMTSRAFESVIPGAQYVLALVVFLFAFSTMITWSYYGERCFTYLFGENAWLAHGYKLAFLACIVIGASAELGNVIRFSDAMLLSMAIPNIIGLYFAAREIKRDTRAYLAAEGLMKPKG